MNKKKTKADLEQDIVDVVYKTVKVTKWVLFFWVVFVLFSPVIVLWVVELIKAASH
ncbi:MAG: hypothetical protein Q8L73_07860 [Methylotenera sp.]|nr:hypothetical protein [Methylotenera sp.]